jgi:hypothetical protein
VLTSGRRPVIKIIAESLSQHDEKHVVPTPLSGIRVGGRIKIIEFTIIMYKSLNEQILLFTNLPVIIILIPFI